MTLHDGYSGKLASRARAGIVLRNRRHDPSCVMTARDDERRRSDLATLLARAYLRLAERSRPGAVSPRDGEQISLDESPQERPDERVLRDVRRAG